MGEVTTLALSFSAGALSTLSPCVLPLLPMPDWLVNLTTQL